MKKEETRLLVKVILCGLGAVLWAADCVKSLSHGQMGLGGLEVAAALLFTAVFVAALRQCRATWRRNKKGADCYDV